MAPQDTGLFRRLLEAYDNLAYFTVLETDTALLKLVFLPTWLPRRIWPWRP